MGLADEIDVVSSLLHDRSPISSDRGDYQRLGPRSKRGGFSSVVEVASSASGRPVTHVTVGYVYGARLSEGIAVPHGRVDMVRWLRTLMTYILVGSPDEARKHGIDLESIRTLILGRPYSGAGGEGPKPYSPTKALTALANYIRAGNFGGYASLQELIQAARSKVEAGMIGSAGHGLPATALDLLSADELLAAGSGTDVPYLEVQIRGLSFSSTGEVHPVEKYVDVSEIMSHKHPSEAMDEAVRRAVALGDPNAAAITQIPLHRSSKLASSRLFETTINALYKAGLISDAHRFRFFLLSPGEQFVAFVTDFLASQQGEAYSRALSIMGARVEFVDGVPELRVAKTPTNVEQFRKHIFKTTPVEGYLRNPFAAFFGSEGRNVAEFLLNELRESYRLHSYQQADTSVVMAINEMLMPWFQATHPASTFSEIAGSDAKEFGGAISSMFGVEIGDIYEWWFPSRMYAEGAAGEGPAGSPLEVAYHLDILRRKTDLDEMIAPYIGRLEVAGGSVLGEKVFRQLEHEQKMALSIYASLKREEEFLLSLKQRADTATYRPAKSYFVTKSGQLVRITSIPGVTDEGGRILLAVDDIKRWRPQVQVEYVSVAEYLTEVFPEMERGARISVTPEEGERIISAIRVANRQTPITEELTSTGKATIDVGSVARVSSTKEVLEAARNALKEVATERGIIGRRWAEELLRELGTAGNEELYARVMQEISNVNIAGLGPEQMMNVLGLLGTEASAELDEFADVRKILSSLFFGQDVTSLYETPDVISASVIADLLERYRRETGVVDVASDITPGRIIEHTVNILPELAPGASSFPVGKPPYLGAGMFSSVPTNLAEYIGYMQSRVAQDLVRAARQEIAEKITVVSLEQPIGTAHEVTGERPITYGDVVSQPPGEPEAQAGRTRLETLVAKLRGARRRRPRTAEKKLRQLLLERTTKEGIKKGESAYDVAQQISESLGLISDVLEEVPEIVAPEMNVTLQVQGGGEVPITVLRGRRVRIHGHILNISPTGELIPVSDISSAVPMLVRSDYMAMGKSTQAADVFVQQAGLVMEAGSAPAGKADVLVSQLTIKRGLPPKGVFLIDIETLMGMPAAETWTEETLVQMARTMHMRVEGHTMEEIRRIVQEMFPSLHKKVDFTTIPENKLIELARALEIDVTPIDYTNIDYTELKSAVISELHRWVSEATGLPLPEVGTLFPVEIAVKRYGEGKAKSFSLDLADLVIRSRGRKRVFRGLLAEAERRMYSELFGTLSSSEEPVVVAGFNVEFDISRIFGRTKQSIAPLFKVLPQKLVEALSGEIIDEVKVRKILRNINNKGVISSVQQILQAARWMRIEAYDVLSVAGQMFPGMPHVTLQDVARRLGIQEGQVHQAVQDVEYLEQVIHMLGKLDTAPPGQPLGDMVLFGVGGGRLIHATRGTQSYRLEEALFGRVFTVGGLFIPPPLETSSRAYGLILHEYQYDPTGKYKITRDMILESFGSQAMLERRLSSMFTAMSELDARHHAATTMFDLQARMLRRLFNIGAEVDDTAHMSLEQVLRYMSRAHLIHESFQEAIALAGKQTEQISAESIVDILTRKLHGYQVMADMPNPADVASLLDQLLPQEAFNKAGWAQLNQMLQEKPEVAASLVRHLLRYLSRPGWIEQLYDPRLIAQYLTLHAQLRSLQSILGPTLGNITSAVFRGDIKDWNEAGQIWNRVTKAVGAQMMEMTKPGNPLEAAVRKVPKKYGYDRILRLAMPRISGGDVSWMGAVAQIPIGGDIHPGQAQAVLRERIRPVISSLAREAAGAQTLGAAAETVGLVSMLAGMRPETAEAGRAVRSAMKRVLVANAYEAMAQRLQEIHGETADIVSHAREMAVAARTSAMKAMKATGQQIDEAAIRRAITQISDAVARREILPEQIAMAWNAVIGTMVLPASLAEQVTSVEDLQRIVRASVRMTMEAGGADILDPTTMARRISRLPGADRVVISATPSAIDTQKMIVMAAIDEEVRKSLQSLARRTMKKAMEERTQGVLVEPTTTLATPSVARLTRREQEATEIINLLMEAYSRVGMERTTTDPRDMYMQVRRILQEAFPRGQRFVSIGNRAFLLTPENMYELVNYLRTMRTRRGKAPFISTISSAQQEMLNVLAEASGLARQGVPQEAAYPASARVAKVVKQQAQRQAEAKAEEVQQVTAEVLAASRARRALGQGLASQIITESADAVDQDVAQQALAVQQTVTDRLTSATEAARLRLFAITERVGGWVRWLGTERGVRSSAMIAGGLIGAGLIVGAIAHASRPRPEAYRSGEQTVAQLEHRMMADGHLADERLVRARLKRRLKQADEIERMQKSMGQPGVTVRRTDSRRFITEEQERLGLDREISAALDVQ